jgi:DNA-binding PucR family transcriptional regulator
MQCLLTQTIFAIRLSSVNSLLPRTTVGKTFHIVGLRSVEQIAAEHCAFLQHPNHQRAWTLDNKRKKQLLR